jgi:recombination protein RecT
MKGEKQPVATVRDVASRQAEPSPAGLVAQYQHHFARVLPPHLPPETFVRIAQAALKTGKRVGDKPNAPYRLEVAAANDVGRFLSTLLDAARLGLMPGTTEYYLTERKERGVPKILGIEGYRGIIRRMYLGGAVQSVEAQVVREHDKYEYTRGRDRAPQHSHKPFARREDRGDIVGVYAYAWMSGGGISRVIELNLDDLADIKAASPGSSDSGSPWVLWYPQMCLKSAARRLEPWVPTSAEYRREVLRATAEAGQVVQERGLPPMPLEAELLEEGFPEAGDAPEGHGASDVGWPAVARPPDADGEPS